MNKLVKNLFFMVLTVLCWMVAAFFIMVARDDHDATATIFSMLFAIIGVFWLDKLK